MNRDWLTYKGLWALSIPSILASMLEPLSSIVDTALVGNFDTNMLAAMAIGVSIMSSITWMFNFLVHAPIQAISQKLAKGEYENVVSLIKLTFLIAFSIGFLLVLIFVPTRHFIYEFLSVTKDLYSLCDEYFLTRLYGHVFILLFMSALSVLRGMAKVNIVLGIIGVATAVNIILSYLGLYQLNMGLSSVAAATIIANAIGFFISLYYILIHEKVRHLFLSQKIILADAFHMGKSSINVFMRSAFLTLSFFLATKVASSISLKALAAHQIILNLWLFASFFTDGVATSGNIIGGTLFRNIGHEYLKEIYHKLLFMGGAIGVFFCLIFTFANGPLVSLFTYDESIHEAINGIIYFLAIAQIPVSIAYVYDGLVFGINRFDFLGRHMLIAFFTCFLPLAYLSYLNQSFLLLWGAIFSVGIYRFISNAYLVRKTLKVKST
ncbi:MATE efflux family protein [Bacteriovorax sp. BAL6_X]|uniref:MATE family efflux transporter n=1 Tax=Bacteriovorax sp. BAL6_X TaxID=1201290 RepID=UPI00038546F8|nr:MATE family efflux transporter [Bacteriovorax sp. BAL6_X]EPZ51120.1 MATE efflux family protein [Bacteriovorax sp. BAL6_X]